MIDAQTPFVTGMTRVRVDRMGRRASGKAEETWVFVWNNLDELLAHLRHLVHDPASRFGLADMLWIMAEARRQKRNTQRRPLPSASFHRRAVENA